MKITAYPYYLENNKDLYNKLIESKYFLDDEINELSCIIHRASPNC
jgi:hypothetical protein